MYNTGNPVPSAALEDMADNAQTFDALVTKTDGTTTDRKGVNRRVFQQIIMDMGFQPLFGSFQTGATITARNQTLYDEVSHVFYSWGGTIPKTVPAGSTPATSGGVGVLLWVDRTDVALRSELNGATGSDLVGFLNRTLANKLSDIVSVLDKSSLQEAIDDSYFVFIPANTTVNISEVQLKSNLVIFGCGDTSVLNVTGGRGLVGTGTTTDETGNITSLGLYNFKMTGLGTFSEFKHLITLSGVSDYTIEGLTLENPQGDHIYLGGISNSSERHNYNGRIKKVKFSSNGVGNRNGISVIDHDGLDISDCKFKGCSLSTMPGDIDLEPNNTYNVLKRIKIHDNVSSGCRSNTGNIVIFISSGAFGGNDHYSDIQIYRNKMRSTVTGGCAGLFVDFNQTSWTDDGKLPVIEFEENTLDATGLAYVIRSVPILKFRKNKYRRHLQASLIGLDGVKEARYLIIMDDEDLDDITTPTYGIRVGGVKTLKIRRQRFGKIGNGTSSASPLAFVGGSSDRVELSDCDFMDTSGASTRWVYLLGHTFTPKNNVSRRNKFAATKLFQFSAFDNDSYQEYGAGYTPLDLPSTIPVGHTMSLLSSASVGLPESQGQGVLLSYKGNDAMGFVFQEFRVRDNGGATNIGIRYFRTSSYDSDAWESWYKTTGTAV